MSFFSQQRIEKLLIGLSVGLLIIVGWLYIHGKQTIMEPPFLPVNDEMKKLVSDTSDKQIATASALPSASTAPTLATTPSPASSTPAPASAITPSSTTPVLSLSPSSSTPALSQSPSSAAPAPSSKRINLNTATLEQLDELPGIGQSKAQAILAYRQQIGQFKSVEQLLEVNGIGEKLLEKLRPYLETSL